MTDLVSQLVGALDDLLIDMKIAQGNMRHAARRDASWEGCAEAIQPRVDAAVAALSAAKAGGWVAVPERTTGDAFENAIRRYGVVAACEWFGHAHDSEFTKETQRVLDERLQPLPAPPAQRGD